MTGNYTTSDLLKLGIEGLRNGLDSESLVILAGLSERDDSCEIKQYFYKTLNEIQVTLPDKRSAAIELAIYYAQKVIENKMNPIEGTSNIVINCLSSYDFSKESKRFVFDSIGFEKAFGLYDMHEDLRRADHSWSVTKTNEQLKMDIKLELMSELKVWTQKIMKTRYNNGYKT